MTIPLGPGTASTLKRTAVAAAKVLVVGAILFVIYRAIAGSGDLGKLEERAAALRTGWPWLAAAGMLLAGSMVMTFLRWKILLEAQGIAYSLREACAIGFIGLLFNQFLLGSTGGDLMRAYYVAAENRERRMAGITTVFLDRLVGIFYLLLFAAIAIPLNWDSITGSPWLRGLAGAVAGLLAVAVAGVAAFFSRPGERAVAAVLARLPLRGLLEKVHGAVSVYRGHPRVMLVAAALSLLVQLALVASTACSAAALGLRADFRALLFIVPLVNLATALPIGMPGGLGQMEAAYAALFGLFGLPRLGGLLVALLQRLGGYGLAVLGGFFYLERHGRIREARRLAREDAAGTGLGAEPAGGSS